MGNVWYRLIMQGNLCFQRQHRMRCSANYTFSSTFYGTLEYFYWSPERNSLYFPYHHQPMPHYSKMEKKWNFKCFFLAFKATSMSSHQTFVKVISWIFAFFFVDIIEQYHIFLTPTNSIWEWFTPNIWIQNLIIFSNTLGYSINDSFHGRSRYSGRSESNYF